MAPFASVFVVGVSALDHVQVAAPPGCEAEARRFYGSLLGLPEIERPEALRAGGGAWFAVGAQELHVGVTGDFSPALKAHPAFLVSDEAELHRLAAALESAGAESRFDDRDTGRLRLYSEDPWGNRIELLV